MEWNIRGIHRHHLLQMTLLMVYWEFQIAKHSPPEIGTFMGLPDGRAI